MRIKYEYHNRIQSKLKILKVLTTIFLLRLCFALTSCCENIYKYYYKEIELICLNNSGKEPVETSEKVIPVKAFGFRVKLEKVLEDYTYHSNFGFHKAVAMSCDYKFELKSKLNAIKIFTLTNFDQNHLSGSEITDYFLARKSSETNINYSEVGTLLNRINADYIRENYESNFDFFITQYPILDSVYQFKIEFNFEDALLVALSDSIKLKK